MATLAAKLQAMRESASGLETVSVDFHRDRTGQTLSESGDSMSGFQLASACVEVGGSLTTQAVSLGSDLSAYSDKVFAAADSYERGDDEAAERIDFSGPEEEPPPVTDPNASDAEKIAAYEAALREAGLLDGPVVPGSKYEQWLLNAHENGVRPETIVDIARTHDIDPEDFEVLEGMKEVVDADGKSFFMIPPGTSAEDIKKAALMTYILNAGTGYDAAEMGDDGIAGTADDIVNDFEETPYSAAEVQRIINRQHENSWSYEAAAQLHRTGGVVSTTPNGMLMALGGKLTDGVAFEAGSTHGDVFALNLNNETDPAGRLEEIIRSGKMYYHFEGRPVGPGSLDLDRILHHEERHSQQWAERGPWQMGLDYGAGLVIQGLGGVNPLEEDAGLSDGGYPTS